MQVYLPIAEMSADAFLLVGIGFGVGWLSGLFGVGGGIIIVPALVYLLGYDQKLASGTSLLAIVLPALVGVVSYGMRGDVDYLLALLLAVGTLSTLRVPPPTSRAVSKPMPRSCSTDRQSRRVKAIPS